MMALAAGPGSLMRLLGCNRKCTTAAALGPGVIRKAEQLRKALGDYQLDEASFLAHPSCR